jgi:predicted secreted Zn-dependent protease
MTRSTVASLAVALAVLVGACSPATESGTPGPSGSAGPASGSPRPVAAASANPCTAPIEHLTAFASRLSEQLAALRPLVTDPAFDSSATATGIRGVSGTLTSFAGLEERLAACPQTARIADAVAAVRSDARTSIEASSRASIQDSITQRAVAAALFGLLPAVEDIASATDRAARAAGIDAEVAVVPDASAQPLGSLPPLATPTPRPTPEPPPDLATFGPAFFGPNTSVDTYRVTGATPLDIVASMLAHGPRNAWLDQRAEAQTRAVPHVRIAFSGTGSSCRIVAKEKPAIYYSFEITLPRWDPPSSASRTTVTWWNAELKRAATHENHHVDLWRAAGVTMTKATQTATCSTITAKLAAIVKSTVRENCEFDMKEYGAALGLSLQACLR